MSKKPKTGGRKKGTPNKASVSLREALDNLKFDLPSELIKLFQDQNIDPSSKVKILSLLVDHVYPRLKEAETPSAPPELPASTPASQVSTENLLTLIKNDPKK